MRSETRQQRRAKERSRSKHPLSVLAGVGALLAAGSASAATITVNSLADTTVAGDTQCTLREALANANGDAETTAGDCTAGSGADTIRFQVGLTGTITLTQGFLPVSEATTIDGPGSSVITISGNDSTWIFEIDAPASTTPVNVAIDGLTLTSGAGNNGGAIVDLNENLTLDDVVVTGNTALNNGGGIYVNAYYSPNLVITNSTISGNAAIFGNGGGLSVYYGSFYSSTAVTLQNDTFSGNGAGYAGGAIAIEIGTNSGSFTMENTVVSSNTAGFLEDVVGVGGGVAVNGPGEGGALPVTIRDSVITGNVADPMDAATVLGSGNTTNDVGYGGGLLLGGTSGTVERTTISGNTAYAGGGMLVGNYSIVALENVTIANNEAKNVSGGATGAGVRVEGSGGNGTVLTVNDSTIGGSSPADGNRAQTGGGGIDATAGQFGTLSVTLSNSIVANNTGTAPDIAGTVTSTYSLIENTTGATINDGTGDITGTDPALAPLATNGSTIVAGAPGSTQSPQTLLPACASPVINAGDPAFTSPPSTDERGLARVVGGRVDMGAVEVNPGIVQFTTNAQSVGENAGTATVTATRTGGFDNAIAVTHATTAGTATAGADYTTTGGTLNWANGDTANKQFTIPILEDSLFEGNETFSTALSSPTCSATIGANATQVITIVDNEVQPTVSISDVTLAEGNAGTTNFVFDVDLSGPSTQTITVSFASSNGTASSPSDYFALSGTMQFNPGVTHQTITVGVNGDTACEPNETFTMTLSAPVNVTIADGTGIGTIVNDDGCSADLSVTKVANGGPFAPGGTATYTITVTNNGPADASGVSVTDTLPAGTSFVAANASQGSCTGTTTVTCSLGTILNGANATVSLTVRFNAAGQVTNTATAITTSDGNPANNSGSATVTVAAAQAIPALDPLSLAVLAALLAFLGIAVVKR